MSEHTPVPTPSRAVYGFTLVLIFNMLFIIYLLWVIVPDKWFHLMGITCFPHRYWAVVVPIFLLTVLATFAFIVYPSMGFIMTPDWSDIITMKDEHSIKQNMHTHSDNSLYTSSVLTRKVCYCNMPGNCKRKEFEKYEEKEYKRKIPILQDLNIVNVSKHLYLKVQ